jgi:sugar-specific transcriptional regulator TrmB
MESIPATLIKSLNDLGLSNNEARVYAALVLYENAEAKDVIDFLSLSKPSVYEALDHLEEIGLAVKRITKPARYSAISPDMAMDLLMDNHRKAAEQALEALRTLEKEKVRTDKEDALWTIYGDKNIEYKIRELFGKAKQQISCMIGERYVPFIENIKIRDVFLQLIVISDDPEVEGRLKKIFPGKKTTIRVVSSEQFKVPPPFAPPEFEEIHNLLNVENILELIVDDEELLMVPPFISGSISVLNTRNKGAILQMKMMSQLAQRRFTDGGEFTFPPHPVHMKKKS